jgi:ferredoxin
MSAVLFKRENRSIEVEPGTTILEAARKAGVIIESSCNGVGVCEKCKVRLLGDSFDHITCGKAHRLPEEEENNGIILACETGIHDNIIVQTVGSDEPDAMKILNHGKRTVCCQL